MTFTMFLIGALYVAVIAALIAYHVNIGFIVILAGGLLFAQYFFSDKMALYGMGGRIVTPEEARSAPVQSASRCSITPPMRPTT